LIDLHSHTDESDGTYSPAELIDEAVRSGLEALAITDHDTLAGYDKALPLAQARGLELICGIELSTKLNGRTVHLLGYFIKQPPSQEFRDWLIEMQESRRDRNRRLIERLQSLGIDITLEEVERKGRSLTGRPHFAKVMVQKGYVGTIQEAFDEYLDESAKGYVDRREPSLAEGIERINRAGGLSSIAHPVRINLKGVGSMRDLVREMKEAGLGALEVYHSDHGPKEVEEYLALAKEFQLGATGGSDFHGEAKPGIRLGIGPGTLNIPVSVLQNLGDC
jgi:3',5'-nucleoside bisphosphate phosphatase